MESDLILVRFLMWMFQPFDLQKNVDYVRESNKWVSCNVLGLLQQPIFSMKMLYILFTLLFLKLLSNNFYCKN